MEQKSDAVRLDKWLWAARFFKTRSMATRAINGGKVHVNGNRVKAARNVAVGDRLAITVGDGQREVTVLALSSLRRPAREAALLYVESEESLKARQEQRDLRRMGNAGFAAPIGRPSKRDRRKIKNFTRKDEWE